MLNQAGGGVPRGTPVPRATSVMADGFKPLVVMTIDVDKVRILVRRLVRHQLDLNLVSPKLHAALGDVRPDANHSCVAAREASQGRFLGVS